MRIRDKHGEELELDVTLCDPNASSLDFRACVMPRLLPPIFDLHNLRTLRIIGCGLEHLSPRVTELQNLTVLSLADNPLRALPDLTPLWRLETVTFPKRLGLGMGLYGVGRHGSWHHSRSQLLLARRKFFFGGAREAIYTLMCIKKFTPVLKLVAHDVVMLVARLLFLSRADPVWKKADKLAYDRWRYHCPWPPPFFDLHSPSGLTCACGYRFGKVEELRPEALDEATVWAIQQRRNAHFQEVYRSDEHGRCTSRSRHYPINRAVQRVLSRAAHRGKLELSKNMVDAVLEKLQARTRRYATYYRHGVDPLPSAEEMECMLFSSDIENDVRLCIADYLRLRAQGVHEPRGTQWNGLYSAKVRREVLAYHGDNEDETE